MVPFANWGAVMFWPDDVGAMVVLICSVAFPVALLVKGEPVVV